MRSDQSPDPHEAPTRVAEFRFYAELNDFLPPERRQLAFEHRYTGNPSVKDTIEALGVPHTEVDLVLIDGAPVNFDHRLRDRARVAVYPVFERVDIAALTHLRPEPLRVMRFIADVHLGTLARHLRLLGFDTAWRNDLADQEIISTAAAEKRIILTRDRGILRNGKVTHGYWVRSSDPLLQMEEVVRAMDLARSFRPYSRCLECNGSIHTVERDDAAPFVPERVLDAFGSFTRCVDCGRVYWAGSHHARLAAVVAKAQAAARSE